MVDRLHLEKSVMEYVQQHATSDELEQYEALAEVREPPELWVRGIDAVRAAFPEYGRRYDLERKFAGWIERAIREGELIAEGRLNGALNWIAVDRDLWPHIRLNAKAGVAYQGVQRYGQIRLVFARLPELHDRMVAEIERYTTKRDAAEHDKSDVIQHLLDAFGPAISDTAREAAWKAARLDPGWRKRGPRRAKVRRRRENS